FEERKPRGRARPGLDGPGALRFLLGHALLDGTGADAAGADPELARPSLHHRAHRLQIHFPAALGDVVGVAHVLSVLDALAADVACPGHETSSGSRERPSLAGSAPAGNPFDTATECPLASCRWPRPAIQSAT